jgi:hypothetical protein
MSQKAVTEELNKKIDNVVIIDSKGNIVYPNEDETLNRPPAYEIKDGILKIPYARTSVAGVSKVSIKYGMAITSDGIIYNVTPTTEQIDNRLDGDNVNYCVTLQTLDYAVYKSFLTNGYKMLVQGTGTRENATMSQKAVTEELDRKTGLYRHYMSLKWTNSPSSTVILCLIDDSDTEYTQADNKYIKRKSDASIVSAKVSINNVVHDAFVEGNSGNFLTITVYYLTDSNMFERLLFTLPANFRDYVSIV